MAQSRKHYRLQHVFVALGTIAATAIFCLFMLPSGCISPGPCGGACVARPSRFACEIIDAAVCPVDGGVCEVGGQCSCIPGLPQCDNINCDEATTEDACKAAVACQWATVCANVVKCDQFWGDSCNSQPGCYFQADKGC